MTKLVVPFTYLIKPLLKPFSLSYQQNSFRSILKEVGRLEEVKPSSQYEAGQYFIHKVYGYRGVVIFHWFPQVNDITVDSSPVPVHPMHNCYYQVLIDSRDWHIVQAHTEQLATIGSLNSSYRSHFKPGLDYVTHQDIIPYVSTKHQPVVHELFEMFFVYQPDQDVYYHATETLKEWQSKYSSRLNLTDVHKETTENVQVTVIPFFLGYSGEKKTTYFWWKYYVRVENLGKWEIQLRGRIWKILSMSQGEEIINLPGIVGQQPILCKCRPIFQYSSYVRLYSPQGKMDGTFLVDREDGVSFECRIPPFMLQSNINEN